MKAVVEKLIIWKVYWVIGKRVEGCTLYCTATNLPGYREAKSWKILFRMSLHAIIRGGLRNRVSDLWSFHDVGRRKDPAILELNCRQYKLSSRFPSRCSGRLQSFPSHCKEGHVRSTGHSMKHCKIDERFCDEESNAPQIRINYGPFHYVNATNSMN